MLVGKCSCSINYIIVEMSFYAADDKDRAVVDLAYSDPSLISEYVFQEWLAGSNELEVGSLHHRNPTLHINAGGQTRPHNGPSPLVLPMASCMCPFLLSVILHHAAALPSLAVTSRREETLTFL